MKFLYNENNHFVINLLGIKFKFKKKKQEENVTKVLSEVDLDTLSNLIRFHKEVYTQHQKVFPKFRNINLGKDVVIVATGETMKKYTPIQNVIHIGVNQAVLQDKIPLDYYFVQDFSGATKNYIYKANEYRKGHCTKFYGIIPQFEKYNIVIPYQHIMDADAYYYYTTHPYDKFNFDISSNELADFYSIVFPALSFAFWTHPKRIYLVGCDCSNLYFDGHKRDDSLEHLITGWEKAKEFRDIYYPDIEMVSINPVGLKGLFKDEYTDGELI